VEDYDMYYQDSGRIVSGPRSLSVLRRKAQSTAANGFHFNMLVSFDKRFTDSATLQHSQHAFDTFGFSS
jgi:hypothetical protein